MTLFAHGLLTTPCHFFRKGLFSVFADVSDTGSTIASEDKSENLAYKVIVYAAFLYVGLAFCTGMKALFLTAFADITPRCFLVFMTARAFPYAVFPTSPTVKSAGRNHLCVSCYFLHNVNVKCLRTKVIGQKPFAISP